MTHTAEVNALVVQHLAGIEMRSRHSQPHAALGIEDHHQFFAAGAAL
jgi:hypothetical protein